MRRIFLMTVLMVTSASSALLLYFCCELCRFIYYYIDLITVPRGQLLNHGPDNA